MTAIVEKHDGTDSIIEIPGFGITLAASIIVPTDGAAGYATGCLYQHLDGTNDTAIYVNEGSNTSCDFNPITNI